MIERLRAKLRSERGQAIVLFVGLFTVILFVGLIVVDFGLWYSERRGAQKDADFVTMAGVYELLEESPSACANASAKADEWALDNDVDPTDDIHNFGCATLAFPANYGAEPTCSDLPTEAGRPNAVYLDIDHETPALFATLFGIADPEVGAHACARAGSLVSTRGLRPWAVQSSISTCFAADTGDYDGDGNTTERAPLFGANCVFRTDASSDVGAVRLGGGEDDPCSGGHGSGGANVYKDNIVNGAGAECSVGSIAETEPGLDTGPTKSALQQLLAGEGECDQKNGNPTNGIDSFSESFEATSGVPGPTVTFADRGCQTPRRVDLIIVDQFDTNGVDHRPIQGFAAFFLEGCDKLDNQGNVTGFYPKCDMAGSNFQIRGFFMSILDTDGDIGDFDQFGTKVIRLVE